MPSRPQEAAARLRTRLTGEEDESPAECAGTATHVVRTATGMEFMMKSLSLMGISSIFTFLVPWFQHVQHGELNLPEIRVIRRLLIQRIWRT